MSEYEQKVRFALKAKAEDIHPPKELKRKVFREIDLLNNDGKMLGKVTVDTLNQDDPFDQLITQLKPGMGISIYMVENNPEKVISNQTNYEYVKWNAGVEELIDRMQPYQIKLPVNADLKEIHVMYGFDSLEEEEIQEMYEEAERTGKRIIVRNLRKSNRMVGVRLSYILEGTCFAFHVLTTTKNRIHVPDINQHLVERTFVRKEEGIYLSDAVNQQLLWVVEQNDMSIQYEIRASHVSKEWIFAIAENLC